MAEKANVEEVSLPDKRLRSLTEKASKYFNQPLQHTMEKLLYSSRHVNELATHAYRDFDNIAVLDDLHQQLNEEHDHFRELAYDFRGKKY